jgi:WD40 repeat protein
VLNECAFLPLPLAVAGSLVARGQYSWDDVLSLFRQARIDRLRADLPDFEHDSVLKALEISVTALSDRAGEAFRRCAVFDEDAIVPRAALERLWHDRYPDALDVADLAQELCDRTLLIRSDPTDAVSATNRQTYRLHDLYFDYLRAATRERIASAHAQFVEAYRAICPEGWAAGPNDGYFFQRMPFHLHMARMTEEVDRLLLDADWLIEKCKLVSLSAFQADLSYLSNQEDAFVLGRVFSQGSHIVRRWPEQLLAQLIARAPSQLSRKIRYGRKPIGLLPKRASLLRDLNLSHTLEAHTGRVNAVALTPDERRAVSASDDGTLKVWDVASGDPVRTLEGHTLGVNAVALTPDGRRAVSASDDGTLKVWDVASGALLRTLKGHTLGVNAVALTPDGRRAVSASDDDTLKVWDMASGALLCTLEGHTGEVNAVALTPDGRRAVSASDDETLKVWDVASGAPLRTLEDHTFRVSAVALTSDGHRAVSASDDGTLKVWDVASGALLRTLEGHTGWVSAVAMMPDGRRAVSASDDETLNVWDKSWPRKTGQGVKWIFCLTAA